MRGPDETPRATLREDERAVRNLVREVCTVLTEIIGVEADEVEDDADGHDDGLFVAGMRDAVRLIGHFADYPTPVMPAAAEQIAPLLAAARVEERERVAVAIEERADQFTFQSGLIVLGLRNGARIARTAPSTDQATTPPGVTGGSGEG